jgi:hypothetical protein
MRPRTANRAALGLPCDEEVASTLPRRSRLRAVLALSWAIAAAATLLAPDPASGQEPPPADSLPPAADSLPPAAESLPSAADTLPPAADSLPSAADTLPPAAATPADTLPADSAAAAAADSLERVRRDVETARERLQDVRQTLETIPAEDVLPRSPRGAVIRAFALPGWGQFYTGHTFRGFMYAGAEAGFATLGFLKQAEVNNFKQEILEARLRFLAETIAASPDSSFSSEDSLAIRRSFDLTSEGTQLQAQLEAKQKRREDYFTYAIFSVIFAAIDAFVSAHLEPFETPDLDVHRTRERWELGVRVPLGRDPTGARQAWGRGGGPR